MEISCEVDVEFEVDAMDGDGVIMTVLDRRARDVRRAEQSSIGIQLECCMCI